MFSCDDVNCPYTIFLVILPITISNIFWTSTQQFLVPHRANISVNVMPAISRYWLVCISLVINKMFCFQEWSCCFIFEFLFKYYLGSKFLEPWLQYVGLSTTLILTKISQWLLDALQWSLVWIFMVPRWWIQMPFRLLSSATIRSQFE